MIDAINDKNVLPFRIDYINTIKTAPNVRDKQVSAIDTERVLAAKERIMQIVGYIRERFDQKTRRGDSYKVGGKRLNGFNSLFATASIDAAKRYYTEFASQQKDIPSARRLKIGLIYSFAANAEEPDGLLGEEEFETEGLDQGSRDFLDAAIKDYNALFATNFDTSADKFQNYYKDLSQRLKNRELDLVIVVGMFLTGFDAPTLNTLFVDKNLRYHGLMQAYSRTNRIFDTTKTFGNIVTFRDLEQATIDAITLFGDKNTRNVVLEKSYTEYMKGFTDAATGEARRGFEDVVKELETRFPDPAAIEKEADKKAFAKLFGEYLRVENVLQNYDEFASLKALQSVDMTDPAAVEDFKAKHYLSDDDLTALQAITIPTERKIQDYRSAYNDVRDWLRREKTSAEKEKSIIDWDDVIFEVDLLKSQEINLDYILELIFEHNKKTQSKSDLVDEVRRVIRASLGNRAKESLLVDFINQTDLDQLGDKATVIDAFFSFAQAEQQREAQELIAAENLNAEAARRYITTSLKREFASDNGTELNAILPKISPLNPQYLSKKQGVFQKIAAFVEKFKGVGGQV